MAGFGCPPRLISCATPKPPVAARYAFDDYEVRLELQERSRSCVLSSALLQNTGSRPLDYVYTMLLVTSAEGVTLNNISINFPPTIRGGKALAAHVDSPLIALSPCSAVRTTLRGSHG